ncbi:MAG: DEAD/DEAH box helicase, partial [Cytophagaceae bacterium]
MKVKDFLGIYRADGLIQTIAEKVRDKSALKIQLKGISGSLDAIIAAAIADLNEEPALFVLHDKEEAAYFQNDLQNLLPETEVLLFPASYKKAYKFEETENANILRRAEVLSAVNSGLATLIVTYPEALAEKVINKKSLLENTFLAKTGEKLDVNFLTELLQTYDFEKSEFVYEAGQYSVRGGILDIFSYANDLPYRIELFGEEIESIRTFDPVTQLSVDTKTELSIVPNVQTRLLQETRESFLNFLPSNTSVWIKDVSQTFDVIERSFEKASEEFAQLMKETAGSSIVTKTEHLFDSATDFKAQLKDHTIVEFGKQFHYKSAEAFTISSRPQPSFNKEFKMLAEDLSELSNKSFTCCIASESHTQIDRLTGIFQELDPHLKFEPLYFPLREGFVDEQAKVAAYTDHQIFDRFHRYKSKSKYSKSKSMTLKELRTLHPGDYISHTDYGIARFAGLEKVEVGGRQQEAIRLVFRDDDLLYISIHALHKISRYSGKEGGPPQMTKLGSGDWDTKKQKVKKKVKDIAKELISLYAKRKAAPGYAYSKDSFLQAELESSFIYEDTPDQAKATADVKEDMQQPHPMDRLVCGDVGFGKTEVAIRAAFKAVCDGKQVAVLVPTTILAMQHYKTFKERLSNLPCSVEYINRFKTNQQIKETLKRVEEGKTNILIGTHRIISKDIKFKELGLLVIDEEQKFGVKVKEKLKEFKVNVDTLTLTATPIPRTLHFSLMGARDLSIIATPPPNRQPVSTEIH